jgi:hypothetical protein
MRTDRELDEILAEIGREYRAVDAPDSLEAVLFAAVGNRKRADRKPRVRLAWTLAAVATLLVVIATAGVVWQSRIRQRPRMQQTQSVPVRRVEPEPKLASARVGGRESVAPRSGVARRSARKERDSSAKEPTWNSLDEFVALPVSEGLPPAAELSVVRMELRGSDLQQYGLQTPADGAARTMLAEFVVGEDGLPRAIRIVR